MVSASRTASLLALRNRTLVAPSRPQAPCTGVKVAGWVRTNSSCCSGVSFTMPQPRRALAGWARGLNVTDHRAVLATEAVAPEQRNGAPAAFEGARRGLRRL